MSKVRVCFLGTPEFAVVSLAKLLKDEHYDVVGVVTQPDRPAGRKLRLTPSPVKSLAIARGVRVISPESVNSEMILQEIQTWGAEVAVVVAFGQILSSKFLHLFPCGAVNIHGSILPRWRGAAPIQRALEAGDTDGGVTLQKIVKELDAGDILGVRNCVLSEDITALELHDQLALLGADLLDVELMDYVRGNLAALPQGPAGVTHAKKINKAEGLIDWSESARKIHNKVRAFTLGPGTYTTLLGKKLKIHRSKIHSEAGGAASKAGQVLEVSAHSLFVETGAGILQLIEVQPESRNRLQINEFLKGNELKKGDAFGT